MKQKITRLPLASDLLAALTDYLEDKLLPALQSGDVSRQRYMLRVALNVIRILQREAARPETADIARQQLQLAEAIRSGQRDETDAELMQQLRTQCLARLAVDNPKYSAYLNAVDSQAL